MTHWDECWTAGPEHYECAVALIRLWESTGRDLCSSNNRLRRALSDIARDPEPDEESAQDIARDALAYPATELPGRDALAEALRDRGGLRDALRQCADYLDCIPESTAGGDDEARRLANLAGAALEGKP
jgi:hypothetical protein